MELFSHDEHRQWLLERANSISNITGIEVRRDEDYQSWSRPKRPQGL